MIQVLALHKMRIQLFVLAAVALIAFAAFSVARPTFGTTTPSSATTALQTTTVGQKTVTVPPQTTSGCSQGAYVTGDLVGDASPAAVYASMCGNR
jgi:hypothetical protein